jgi:acyl-CoA thioesterase FadM
VFNGNYARYWDDAATDWLEELGLGGPELGGNGVEVVTARLETSIQVAKFGTASMDLEVQTVNASSGDIVAAGKLVWVFVDPEHFRPVPVPSDIKETLESGVSAI